MRLENSILRNSIQTKDLAFYRHALANVQISDAVAFCWFPDGCNQNLLGILGDFFISLEEAEFVVLCARNAGVIRAIRQPKGADGRGEIVLLDDQDRSLWDREEIAEGLGLVEHALRAGPPGPYALQAAIAAVHAEAPAAADTDWPQIVGLYEELYRRLPTPVVALNRAAAVAMAHGPARGLRLVDELAGRGTLDGYYLLHATRADLLRRLGRADQARAAYARALALATNPVEQAFLQRRLDEGCRPSATG